MKLPDNLPPLPPVPEGFDRWEYRGRGWTSPNEHRYAVLPEGNRQWQVMECEWEPMGRDMPYIEAVRAQPAESAATGVESRVSGWQDIETAPRDARVMLLCPGGRIVCGKFINQPFFSSAWHVDVPCLGGWGEDNAFALAWHEDLPTHWMPLPDPPKNC